MSDLDSLLTKTSSTCVKEALAPLLVLLEARFQLASEFSEPGAVNPALVVPVKRIMADRLKRLVFLAENNQEYDDEDRQAVHTLDTPLIVALTGTSSGFNNLTNADFPRIDPPRQAGM
jgi:hypothetical protein